MAQSKKRAQRITTAKADDPVDCRKSRFRFPGGKRKVGRHGEGLTVRDYVVMNLVFDAFCVVQLIIVSLLLRDFAGLYFFFGFLMCAFLIASIFDYFSERLNMGVSTGDDSEITND